MKFDLISRIGAKLFLPFILVFGLYVQFHGDYGPGGGFQAGVIAAAMIILYAIIFGLPAAQRIVPPIVVEIMVPLGALIYAGTGVVTMFKGGNYLNYTVLGHDQVHAQEWGIFLVELGVLITVAGTMVAIFYAFAGRGR
jgi:multicomponent Na+:H+ antiporter subunit B